MKLKYPGGVWPVMLTPFTRAGEVDTEGLTALRHLSHPARPITNDLLILNVQ